MSLSKRPSSAIGTDAGRSSADTHLPQYSYGSASLATSVAILKELGELTARIPYIKAAAGVLLRIIEVNDQVELYQDRWREVMENIAHVAQILHETSVWCERGGYVETDLPVDLRHVLGSMKSHLECIENALEQCRIRSAKWKQFRRIFLRSDMLKKIDQCDRRLKKTLDVCNTSLLLTICANQQVSDSQVTAIASRLPARPQIFHGRDEHIEAIIALMFNNSRTPARIAILGPGGIGKTALSLATLHHPLVQAKFKDLIYFVQCEACLSAAALLVEIAQTLKIQLDQSVHLDQKVISMLSLYPACLICLDNFETCWDVELEEKRNIEALLARITALPNVTLLLTMRGAERPAETAWTQPWLSPLAPFDAAAAKQTFTEISGKWDKWAEIMMDIVEGLPLAVTLLAHLAQSLSCQQLWQRWEQKHIESVERYKGHKMTSLEVSIQLSIEGGRMKADMSAQSLLSILSILPGGLNLDKVKQYQKMFPDISDIMQSILPLQQSSLAYTTTNNYLHTHSLIRYYCQVHHPPMLNHVDALEEYHIQLSLKDNIGKADIFEEQLSEIKNTQSILTNYTRHTHSKLLPSYVSASLRYSELSADRGMFSDILLSTLQLKGYLILPEQKQRCFVVWGCCLIKMYKPLAAKEKYFEALEIAEGSKDYVGQGNALIGLADTCLHCNEWNSAFEYYSKALEMHTLGNHRQGQADSLNQLGSLLMYYNNIQVAEEKITKAYQIHQEQGNIRGQAFSLKLLGHVSKEKYNFDHAMTCYKKAYMLYGQIYSSSGQGGMLVNIGNLYMTLNNLAFAKDYLEQALEQITLVHDSIAEGQALQALGYIAQCNENYNEAINHYEHALKIYQEIDNISYQAGAWYNIANVYKLQRKTDKAMDSINNAYLLHGKIQDIAGQGLDLYMLGLLHYQRSEFTKARDCWFCSVSNYRQCGMPNSCKDALHSIGESYFYQNETDIENTKKYYNEALLLCNENSFDGCKGNVLCSIGHLYVYLNKTVDAIYYYNAALDEHKRTNYRHGKKMAYQYLGELYENIADSTQAQEYYDMAISQK
ncbi:TPR-like protein [Artomyces pyxidatus]|uniref:TPR-like protein n=1 Tax=Artomyces pyxidatus TaxID=48021 RepID=A0ACB8SF42_9AGAM|nr:TPR-like protein [Artomyces pyxidatus]